jgi:methylenetetrahydrofolate dehydrogenase (NADP+)/methenyltetrahydrofolate cyclohydrolase
MQANTSAQILDGKAVASTVREELRVRVEAFVQKGRRPPGLAVVLIGDDPASHIYVKNKIQACKKAGIESFFHQFPADVEEDEILRCVGALNEDKNVDGILVQLPLPAHLKTDRILDAVLPGKDVDGLHPFNLGLLAAGKPGLRPCTPSGVMVLLERYKVPLAGANAVVIGRSNLVGKPVALMLLEKHASVTICHSRSKNLDEIARRADILVVAAGRQCMVKGAWLKPGAVVVDVGIHKRTISDGPNAGESEVVGDVDFKEALTVASLITPVPGGVGPMTIAMLLSNTLDAYEQHMATEDS